MDWWIDAETHDGNSENRSHGVSPLQNSKPAFASSIANHNWDDMSVQQSHLPIDEPRRGYEIMERERHSHPEPRRGDTFIVRKMNKGIQAMKQIDINKFAVAAVVLAAFLLAGCGNSAKSGDARTDTTAASMNKGERKVLFWYDPMNPTVHFNHPGKSPFMDMPLQPMYADQDNSNPNVVKVDPAMVQDIGVVTAPVERRNLTRTIHTYGVVIPDEKNITDINTRVGGWIDRLYFDYTGMQVRKGEPMAVIYSPELIAAEQEFLQSVNFAGVSGNSVTQSNTLIQSARERLSFFGMSNREIDELQRTGKVIQRVVIHSPGDGVILEKDVFEGQKIMAGQSLFKVADLHHVWVLADVFKIDMPFLKLGSPASIVYDHQESYDGRVDFVYPQVDPTSRSVKVRIPLNNPGLAMKVGQYVDVAIHSPVSYDAIAVPSQAVINTGLRQVVAVALGGGRFEIRDVKLGVYADGYYEVTSGLMPGETIVTSGQFLIDSDANLRSAGAALTAGSADTAASMNGMKMDHEEGEHGEGNKDNMQGMEMNEGKPETGDRKPGHGDLHGMDMNEEKSETGDVKPEPGAMKENEHMNMKKHDVHKHGQPPASGLRNPTMHMAHEPGNSAGEGK